MISSQIQTNIKGHNQQNKLKHMNQDFEFFLYCPELAEAFNRLQDEYSMQ